MADLVLEIVEGNSAGTSYPLDQPIEVGRNQTLAVVLDDVEASRRHARVTPSNGAAVVEDLGSRNGSFVNEQQIDSPRQIGPGDRVRFGLTVFEVHSAQAAARGASGVIAVPPITQLDHGVLAPVQDHELPPPAPEPQVPGVRIPETEPAYVPNPGGLVGGGPADQRDVEEGEQYQRVAALRDPRVKHVTRNSAFALLALSALAVILFFGVAS